MTFLLVFKKLICFPPRFDKTSFGGHLALESPGSLPKGYVGCFCFPTPSHHQHHNAGLYDAGQPCMNTCSVLGIMPHSFLLPPTLRSRKESLGFLTRGQCNPAVVAFAAYLPKLLSYPIAKYTHTYTPKERLPHPLSRPDPLQIHSLG